MERYKTIKILVGISVVGLMFPLYFGYAARQQVLSYLHDVDIPGYELEAVYHSGLLSSSLNVHFQPKYDYLKNYAFNLKATIHHGPFLPVSPESGEGYIQQGMAGIKGSIFWHQKQMQQFSGVVDLDKKTTLNFVRTPYKGSVEVAQSQILMDWRGLEGKFSLSSNARYQLTAVLYPFAWRNEDNEERHIAATNLKFFGQRVGQSYTIDALDISSPEVRFLNRERAIDYALKQTHLSFDSLASTGHLRTIKARLSIAQLQYYSRQMGPFAVRTEVKNIDRQLFGNLWAALYRVKEELTIAHLAKESEMFLKSLPKADINVSLLTEQGLFSAHGQAKANKNLVKIPQSMLKMMPSYLLLRLINAEAELIVPEAFVLDSLDRIESSTEDPIIFAKKVRYLFDQLRARNAIAKVNDNLKSELKLYDGTPSVNGEPIIPLMFSLMASLLLVD